MTLGAYYYSRPARGPTFSILSYILIHLINSHPWTSSLEAWTDSYRAEGVGILLEICTINYNNENFKNVQRVKRSHKNIYS